MSMTFYKIIQNGEAVDAAFTWLKWYPRHNILLSCEPQEANYVASYDGNTIYRVEWLNPLPSGAPVFATADCRIIDAQEYEDLRAVLDDGETVPEPYIPEPEPEPETNDPEPDPNPAERPMTVQEMRAKITEQEEQIAMLTECILEMSEVIYGE